MNSDHWNSVKEDFIKDLNPKYIMPSLLEYKVVTKEESKNILLEKDSSFQVNMLFKSIKGQKEYENFLKVLNMEDKCGVNYPWLAEKLTGTNFILGIQRNNALNQDVHRLLIFGHVPFQINNLLHREKKLQEIRKNLIDAANSPLENTAWVVLHGMTGTGKSVLASEAVRNNELIMNYFNEGVFWISLGQDIDRNALELKMNRLYQKILMSRGEEVPENKYSLANEKLDDLRLSLTEIVSRKMLIILDDLWGYKHTKIHEINVVSYFNIGCPVLVTTRFPGEFEEYSQNCFKVPCKNDLDLEERKELLAMYAKCTKDELPSEVDFICEKCKGSPFTLSHIGRWINSCGNHIHHWQKLKELLEKGLALAMRQRHSSDKELKRIKDIVLLTLKPVEDDKNFYDFVIFPEDEWVPIEVFSVLWDMDRHQVDMTMNRLVESSLVQYEKEKSGYSYGINDLYLEILKEICLDKQERHLRLINNFLKKCKEDGIYDFSKLPNDDYIHRYIGYHISHVDTDKIIDGIKIDDIYFNLKFIESKLKMDPRDLIWDYEKYSSLFENKEFLVLFKSFADKHAYTIFNNKDCDIIQLALFEPADSVIYKQAFDLASRSKNKTYFEWCNEGENHLFTQNLNLKLYPFKEARHATISSDGVLIACAGSENTVKIFSFSGDELQVLKGHTSSINYCMFNHSGDKLITASDDFTVRIFKINILNSADMKPTRKRLSFPTVNAEAHSPDTCINTFDCHTAPVLCCCYSKDKDLIVSSDSIGVVFVWLPTDYLLVKRRVEHKPRVEICSFNPGSTLFGTVANDSIKLWNVDTGECYQEFSHGDMIVKGFCFTNDDVIISIVDKTIYKNNIKTKMSETFQSSKSLVFTCCCLSPDGNFLACGTSENSVMVYNKNNGELVSNLKGHKSGVLCVNYTKDGTKLLAASESGYYLYNMSRIQDMSVVSCEGNLSVRQYNNDLTIASSDCFNSIEIRKGIIGQLICKTNPERSEITACSLSNDCSEVVYGTNIGDVKVFRIEENIVDDSFEKHNGKINYITHNTDNLFFTCSEDKTIKVWHKSSPKILRGHSESVLMCVPFKKSPKLLSCSEDGTLRVWDIISGKAEFFTEGHDNQDVRFCDISSDDEYLASASTDGTVKLYLAQNGNCCKKLDFGNEVRCCRFCPIYPILLAGCDSGEVKIWQYLRKNSLELWQHSSCVYSVLFSEDGSQFLSIADDIKISNIEQPTATQTILLPSSSMGVLPPNIWVNDTFDLFVVVQNSYLYILRKI